MHNPASATRSICEAAVGQVLPYFSALLFSSLLSLGRSFQAQLLLLPFLLSAPSRRTHRRFYPTVIYRDFSRSSIPAIRLADRARLNSLWPDGSTKPPPRSSARTRQKALRRLFSPHNFTVYRSAASASSSPDFGWNRKSSAVDLYPFLSRIPPAGGIAALNYLLFTGRIYSFAERFAFQEQPRLFTVNLFRKGRGIPR